MPHRIRSEIISTYALCGFANLGSIGVQLGGLGPMAPHRVTDMSKIAIRALFAGTIACFMTACVAGKSIRSEIISTYALCGFANLGSIGVQLGGLGPMAPHRVTDMSKIAIRALFAGTIACFMTACVAGVLYDESLYEGAVAIGTLAPNVWRSPLPAALVVQEHTRLTNITPNILQDGFDLPVQVTHGFVGEISLTIPWTNLYSSPCDICIEDVYLIASPVKEQPYDAEKARASELAVQRKRLRQIEESLAKKATESTDGIAHAENGDSFVEKLMAQVIKNLKVSVKNIHIRYEDQVTSCESPFAVGFTLQNLSAETTDDNWKTSVVNAAAKTVFKLVSLDNLAVYWNPDQHAYDLYGNHWNWKGKMEDGISTKAKQPKDYEYILQPLSAECHVIMDQTSKVEMDVPKQWVRTASTLSVDEVTSIQAILSEKLHPKSDGEDDEWFDSVEYLPGDRTEVDVTFELLLGRSCIVVVKDRNYKARWQIFLGYYPAWPLGPRWCKLWQAVFIGVGSTQINTLAAISIDRCSFVKDPFKHRFLLTLHKAITVCIVTWSLGVVTGVFSLLFIVVPRKGRCDQLHVNNASAYTFTGLAANLVVLFVVIVVSYLKLHAIAKKQFRTIYSTRDRIQQKILTGNDVLCNATEIDRRSNATENDGGGNATENDGGSNATEIDEGSNATDIDRRSNATEIDGGSNAAEIDRGSNAIRNKYESRATSSNAGSNAIRQVRE
ncbi:predicted protein [Nematostella vectensis]|uniref:G-protein coupled receptors family 1 profile domain-containing protein n=1 Tax=Nematostella vectensis TaxID=45351 RepID=A7S2R0_NEMVE|nr:predicted protein [Nematostella vectensis]|eukprot:XP_001634145.1 predicted protein [Nematostella vectensis]